MDNEEPTVFASQDSGSGNEALLSLDNSRTSDESSEDDKSEEKCCKSIT